MRASKAELGGPQPKTTDAFLDQNAGIGLANDTVSTKQPAREYFSYYAANELSADK
jgi:hypothetical protein